MNIMTPLRYSNGTIIDSAGTVLLTANHNSTTNIGVITEKELHNIAKVATVLLNKSFEYDDFDQMIRSLSEGNEAPNKPAEDKILTGWEKNKFKTDNDNSLDLKSMQTLCVGSGLENTMDYFKRLYYLHESGKFIRAQSGFAKMPERFQNVFLKWLSVEIGTTEADIYNFFLKTNNHDN